VTATAVTVLASHDEPSVLASKALYRPVTAAARVADWRSVGTCALPSGNRLPRDPMALNAIRLALPWRAIGLNNGTVTVLRQSIVNDYLSVADRPCCA